MKKQLFIFILLLVSSGYLLAQKDNLIPNSSFEEYKDLPLDIAEGKRCLAIWSFPNYPGNGDYYHSNVTNKKANTNKNYFGKQIPHSGEAYAGICITKNFREYLQVKLTQSLVKNTTYIIELYISCADKAYLSTVQEFGAILSKKEFTIISNDYLLKPPPVKFFTSEAFTEKKEWIKLTCEYVSNGTEEYFTFGCFLYEEENGVVHGETSGIAKYAHYYIDDISIKELEADKKEIEDNVVEKKLDSLSLPFDVEVVNTFNSLHFKSGQATILPLSFNEIDQLILFMLEYPNLKLVITGHTDNRGNADENIILSLDRANSVKMYITTHSTVSEGMIQTFGKGDSLPKFTNNTEENRKKNRRVEFLLK